MTNPAISQAAVDSWAVPEIAAARSRRYVAALKVGRKVTEFKSVGAALRSLGLTGSRGIRGAALEHGSVELNVDGKKVLLAVLPKEMV